MNLPLKIRNHIGIPFATVNALTFREGAEAFCHYLYHKKRNIYPLIEHAQQLRSTLSNNEIGYAKMAKIAITIINNAKQT